MTRSRVSTARAAGSSELDQGDIVASADAADASTGADMSETWLRTRGITPPTRQRWHVEITLDVVDGPPSRDFDESTTTRFHIDIYSEEWGVFFCHQGRSSWIRVTDTPSIHGRDDYGLLGQLPPLDEIGALLRHLEQQHAIRFQRQHAAIRSNLARVEPSIRTWVLSL
jgi:hypothetical protein